MARVLFFSFVSLLIFSCSDDDPVSDNSQLIPEPIIPLEVGNYWIYNLYLENADGELQLSSNLDSMYVESIEEINGENYYNLVNLLVGSNTVKVKDSLGYLVSSEGLILYSPNDDEGIISTQALPVPINSFIYINYEMQPATSVDVPAGTFEARKVVGNVDLSETDFTCNKRNEADYVEGIGLIREQLFYLSDCRTSYKELVRYNIQ